MARISEVAGPLDTPCWVPNYGLTNMGYTRMRAGRSGRRVYSHRLAYEHFVGPIPEGLQLDHHCRNRACCNPAHLEPVTNQENFVRGSHPHAVIYRTGLCPRGHSMDEAYVSPAGARRCRTCRDELMREYRARKVVTS